MDYNVKMSLVLVLILSGISLAQTAMPERGSNGYMDVYCFAKSTTSGHPKYNEPVIYGEPPQLEIELSLINETKDTVLLPERLQDHLVLELKRDNAQVLREDLDITWDSTLTKYKHEETSDANEQLLTSLEPGTLIRTGLTIKLKSNRAFEPGYYRLQCALREGALKAGKSRRGGEKFRIVNPETREDLKASYVFRGNQYLKAKQPEKALEAYQKASELEPDNLAADTGMGYAYLALRDYRNAIRYFEKVLARTLACCKSGLPGALAQAYLAVGDEKKAIDTLQLIMTERDVEKTIEQLKGQMRKQ